MESSTGDLDARADYIGSATCASCHDVQQRAWSDSLHAAAMRPAIPPHVHAAFDGTRVPWAPAGHAVPQREGDRFVIDVVFGRSEPARHLAAYALGRAPLEQHLVTFPGGRLQPLPVAFDTARSEWFDVFASDPREPSDWGYWANRGMTANTQCLYCHTTGYEKGYAPASDQYETRWAELGVTCEACHGPGAAHVARHRAGTTAGDDPYRPLAGDQLLDLCAACHALRRDVAPGFRPGAPFLDHFEPVLLDGAEYHPDGQLLGETYEWGSFLQSAKYQRGIGCTACHEPHGARLRAEGNDLCLGCHDARLGSPAHTHHDADGPGAACVACHMPVTVYMERDPRHDHSFSLPDPERTRALGIPSACDRCHAERDPAWAAAQVQDWFGAGEKRQTRLRLAVAIAQGRRGDPASVRPLQECLAGCRDAVHRASAARLLAQFGDRAEVREALMRAARSGDPLTRFGAVWALAELGPRDEHSRKTLLAATDDPVRVVRVNAAWGLRTLALASLPPAVQASVTRAFGEWEGMIALQAEHPEAQHTHGVFLAARGDHGQAQAAYRSAIALAPASIAPRYNLALSLVATGDTAGAERELGEIRALDPAFAPAAYALGVLYGNTGRWAEAVRSLRDCLDRDPTYPGALYDLALAALENGASDEASHVLEAAAYDPGTRTEAVRGLVAIHLRRGDHAGAARWARQANDPALGADPRLRTLLD